MGPRASRRRVITISDDEDEPSAHNIEETTAKPTKRSTRGSKSATNGSSTTKSSRRAPTPTQSPQKSSKATKAASAKEPVKPVKNPIYSFFNAATQRQQTQQPSSSAGNLSTLHEDIENIQDDIDDDRPQQNGSATTLSKGSSTALAMRKRKFERTQSTEDATKASGPPSASQKFRKTSGGDRGSSLSIINEDKRPWTDQFAPVDLSELAIHKRKVTDVRTWLETFYRGRHPRVLMLKGPAGSGKTTTIQLLAKDLGVELIEWKDTAGSDYSSENFVSASSRFDEFVARAGKSNGLTLYSSSGEVSRPAQESSAQDKDGSDDQRKALVIEEFPNTFAKTSPALQAFRTTISQYLASPSIHNSSPIPIIMIISETLLTTNTAAADSFTAHRLLGPELMTHPYVNTIEFNPVAPTFLTKALETIVVKEARKSGRRKTPGPQVLKHLAEIGDIRSAVSTLEFLCLRGDDKDTWSSKVSFTKTKSTKTQPPLTKAEEEALKLICNRESSLGIFHSVGKVVYNKRVEPQRGKPLAQPPDWLPQHRRDKIPETDADSLIDELGTDTSTFLAALHENYALSCSCPRTDNTLDCLGGCMDNLSDADLLSLDRFSFGTRAFSGSTTDGLRQDDMCFQIGVRGLLFSLPNPIHRSAGSTGNRGEAHRMYYPASLKLWKKKEEVEDTLQLVVGKLAAGSAMASTKSGSKESGVEGWKRNAAFEAKSTSSDQQNSAQQSSEAKKEMLMDRLPYLSHILSGQKPSRSSQMMLDQLRTITRISGMAPTGEDDADMEDGETVGEGAEAWATDRPDADTAASKKRLTGKKVQTFEKGSIPVETKIEKLILEDDDIVDD